MGAIGGIILFFFGAINAISPETGWHMSEGWKFKDAEPSEAALLWGRICGIVLSIIGVVMIFRS